MPPATLLHIDAEESTVVQYNATVAELAHLCHCLKTQSFLPPRFHFSQLAQLPFEWPMALGRLQLRPKCLPSGSRTNSQRATTSETWLETTCEQLRETTLQRQSRLPALPLPKPPLRSRYADCVGCGAPSMGRKFEMLRDIWSDKARLFEDRGHPWKANILLSCGK